MFIFSYSRFFYYNFYYIVRTIFISKICLSFATVIAFRAKKSTYPLLLAILQDYKVSSEFPLHLSLRYAATVLWSQTPTRLKPCLSLLYMDVAISFSFRTSSSFVSLLEHHPPSLPHGATSLIESTAPRWRFARRGSWRTSACSSANSAGSFLSSISQRRSVRMVLGHWARGSRSPLFSSPSRDCERYREFVSLRRRGSSVCGRSRRVTGPSGFDLFLLSLERTHLRPGTTAIPTESVIRDMRPVDDSICCEEIEREFLWNFPG